MNGSPRGKWAWAAFLALLASMAFSRLQHPLLALANNERPGTERPALMAAVAGHPSYSLGFRNVLADITWLKAVQVAGSLRMAREEYDLLYELLVVVSDLDRRFEVPYLLGGLILGESPNHGREALTVLGRGKGQFPKDWRFPFYMGFTHYFTLGDPAAAGTEMMAASTLPGCPEFVPGLATRMMSEAGDLDGALSMLASIARQETNPTRRSVLERRMRETVVERDLRTLEKAVESYREKTGHHPGDFEELVRAGFLDRIPVEPNGGTYLMEEGGKVRSSRVAQRLQVFQRK